MYEFIPFATYKKNYNQRHYKPNSIDLYLPMS